MKFAFTLFLLLAIFSDSIAQHSPPAERYRLAEQFLSQQKDASGFFLIASGGEVRFTKGIGYADRNNQTMFTDQTLYSIGSITKSFTATAILLLAERGQLNVNDAISKYFDDVPTDKKDITIHQLLTHSAGLPGAIGDDYVAISTDEFQKLTWNTPLEFSPGTGYGYSNVGYSLLGIIIEKISGQRYSEFLEKNIFQPAGMKTAGYANPNADYSKLAHGYFADGRDWGTAKDKKWDGDEPYWHLKANGGILMSAQDLLQWYRALRDHKILKPETLKLQVTPHVREGEDESYYGYGYAVSKDGEVVQHNGGNRIFKADFRWYPKMDLALISVSNAADTRLFMLNDQLMDILMTGQLPEMQSWSVQPLEKFPANEMQQVGKKFIELLQQYSSVNKDAFVSRHFTTGLVERNGEQKLNNLFSMLSQDIGKGAIQKVETFDQTLRLTIPANDPGARLKLKLVFKENQIDKISAEMEGM